MSLNPVLHKIVMPSDVITDIVLHRQEVDPVEGDHASHRIVNSIAAGERFSDIPVHVEVDAVAADDARLPAVEELGVTNMSDQTILGTTCQQ